MQKHDHAGVMRKSPGSWRGRSRDRYFELEGSVLRYYDSTKMPPKLKGVIDLNGADIDFHKTTGLAVTPADGKRTYILCAKTEANVVEWMDHMTLHQEQQLSKIKGPNFLKTSSMNRKSPSRSGSLTDSPPEKGRTNTCIARELIQQCENSLSGGKGEVDSFGQESDPFLTIAYYVDHAGDDHMCNLFDLVKLVRAGELNSSTECWAEGLADWDTLHTVSEVMGWHQIADHFEQELLTQQQTTLPLTAAEPSEQPQSAESAVSSFRERNSRNILRDNMIKVRTAIIANRRRAETYIAGHEHCIDDDLADALASGAVKEGGGILHLPSITDEMAEKSPPVKCASSTAVNNARDRAGTHVLRKVRSGVVRKPVKPVQAEPKRRLKTEMESISRLHRGRAGTHAPGLKAVKVAAVENIPISLALKLKGKMTQARRALSQESPHGPMDSAAPPVHEMIHWRSSFPDICQENGLSEEEVEHIWLTFVQFDFDRSGAISPEELREGMALLNQSTTDDDIAFTIDKFDTNKSGALEFDQFTLLVREWSKGEAGVVSDQPELFSTAGEKDMNRTLSDGITGRRRFVSIAIPESDSDSDSDDDW